MHDNNGAGTRKAARGFTLVELMTVVAVVALLATLATSSYSNYTRRANRTEGRAALLAIQVAQEKYFLQNNQYVQNIAGVIATPPAGLGIPLSAAGLTANGNYTISFQVNTPTQYRLAATAGGSQANDSTCPVFTVDDQGNRTPADSTGCWR